MFKLLLLDLSVWQQAIILFAQLGQIFQLLHHLPAGRFHFVGSNQSFVQIAVVESLHCRSSVRVNFDVRGFDGLVGLQLREAVVAVALVIPFAQPTFVVA